MKTKVLFVAFLIALGSALTANAQLTTGVSSSKVIRTGNRAKAGDCGIYAGATLNLNDDVTPLPLINFKYMSTDNFEMRIGLEASRNKEKLVGDIRQSENTITKDDQKYGNSTLMLYPGIAYHFSKMNILDVYVGAELPLGWDASTSSTTATDYTSKITKRSFVLGLGAFIGLQAYIADLPLALGVEYGLSSRLDTGLKYKNEFTTNNQTTITYSPTNDFKHVMGNNTYDKLKARRGELGSQIRLTLSYYFK